MARVFSHKPTMVSGSEKGTRHDGTVPGFSYWIVKDVSEDDFYPHPNSSMEPGKEWLTTKVLKVEPA